MSEKVPQTRSNHLRMDPQFHYFLLPVLLFLFIWTLVHLYHHRDGTSGILVGLAVAGVVTAVKARTYSLKVQNRIIRLEERLRLAAILNEPLRSRTGELTEAQLTALRFAPDEEVSALVSRALNDKLGNKEIKEAIQNWRGDYYRV